MTLTDEAGCSFDLRPASSIAVLETVTPAVDFDGQLGFCEGGSVILCGPDRRQLDAWNVGADAQSLEVCTAGAASTLDFTDVCGNTATSDRKSQVDVYGHPVRSGHRRTSPSRTPPRWP